MSEENHVISHADQVDMRERIHPRLKELAPGFMEAGALAAEVHEKKLWVMYANSFQDYCENELGWSRQRVYQIMSAYKTRSELPTECQTIVDTESKARALTKVPPKARAKVVREASRNGSVTAKSIEESAQRIIQPKAQKEKPQLLDKTGYPVPENLVPLFGRAPEVAEVLTRISATRGLLRRVSENKDILWSPVNFSVAMIELDKAFAEMKCALPFAVCPYCQGRSETMTHCNACKGRGVVSEFFYDHAVPTDIKGVREKSCKK